MNKALRINFQNQVNRTGAYYKETINCFEIKCIALEIENMLSFQNIKFFNQSK